jgi:hypothetical protein
VNNFKPKKNTMTGLKFINTHKDYWLLLDESQRPQYKKWYYVDGRIELCWGRMDWTHADCPSVIAHLPKKDAPVIEGVWLLPELPKQEEDVVQIPRQRWERLFKVMQLVEHDELPVKDLFSEINLNNCEINTGGYKAASQKKWSDEDVKKAMLEYAKWLTGGPASMSFAATVETAQKRILQTLSPATLPVDFIPELIGIQEQLEDMDKIPKVQYTYINNIPIRTSTNEKGEVVIQGTYKF